MTTEPVQDGTSCPSIQLRVCCQLVSVHNFGGSFFHGNSGKTRHKPPVKDVGNPINFMVIPYTCISP